MTGFAYSVRPQHIPLRGASHLDAGFSRGAYTAKWSVPRRIVSTCSPALTFVTSLAGMLHKVGLLPACNHQQVPFAYKMYKSPDAYGWKQSNEFKKAFSIDVDIEFLGVW